MIRIPLLRSSTRTPPTIVVAEDEPSIGDMVAMSLEENGYRVCLTRDGLECVELLERTHEEVAAVLLDLTLPGASGAEVFTRLRKFAPSLPVVVMSGSAEAHSPAEGGVGDGIASFLPKPFRLPELFSTVASALRTARHELPA